MGVSTLTLATERKDTAAKTRTFSVHLLGYLTADSLWEPGGDGSARRPVWLAYFGTERETHPFTANLRAGRQARTQDGLLLEIGHRAPHRWTSQKVPNGLVTVVYLSELFHLEPAGPPGEPVRFVFAPARWWVAREAATLAGEFGEEAPDAARAALFCAYLDRRTPLPLVHGLRFHLQVYRAALEREWLYRLAESRGEVLVGRGAESTGLDAPVACSVGQPELAAFLVEQTSLYHQEEIRRGKTRVAAGGWLLSDPAFPPSEHRIDLDVA
ncbi:MAG: hypothetical protein M3O15_01985 [Acidobacteriota bacterium]|nr:hypothetical protein [Acidobacteriota bacterium]